MSDTPTARVERLIVIIDRLLTSRRWKRGARANCARLTHLSSS
jgi:hypothetical protein